MLGKQANLIHKVGNTSIEQKCQIKIKILTEMSSLISATASSVDFCEHGWNQYV